MADLDTLDLPQGGDAAPNPEQELIALEDGERLRQAIAGLPSPFLETLVMRDINALSYREIAEATETPVGTGMSRLAREREMPDDPALAAEYRRLTTLRNAVRRHAPREAAPQALADRIAALTASAPAPIPPQAAAARAATGVRL